MIRFFDAGGEKGAEMVMSLVGTSSGDMLNTWRKRDYIQSDQLSES